jgi:hypothetical protein
MGAADTVIGDRNALCNRGVIVKHHNNFVNDLIVNELSGIAQCI